MLPESGNRRRRGAEFRSPERASAPAPPLVLRRRCRRTWVQVSPSVFRFRPLCPRPQCSAAGAGSISPIRSRARRMFPVLLA